MLCEGHIKPLYHNFLIVFTISIVGLTMPHQLEVANRVDTLKSMLSPD